MSVFCRFCIAVDDWQKEIFHAVVVVVVVAVSQTQQKVLRQFSTQREVYAANAAEQPQIFFHFVI